MFLERKMTIEYGRSVLSAQCSVLSTKQKKDHSLWKWSFNAFFCLPHHLTSEGRWLEEYMDW